MNRQQAVAKLLWKECKSIRKLSLKQNRRTCSHYYFFLLLTEHNIPQIIILDVKCSQQLAHVPKIVVDKVKQDQVQNIIFCVISRIVSAKLSITINLRLLSRSYRNLETGNISTQKSLLRCSLGSQQFTLETLLVIIFRLAVLSCIHLIGVSFLCFPKTSD